MRKKKRVAVIGASGAVGKEIVHLLHKRSFPFSSLKLFASEKSVGQKIEGISIEKLTSLKDVEIAFFAAGSHISKEWILKTDAFCIDSSSFFRDQYPLIIPEINPEAMTSSIVCSPNCAATIMLMPLYSLHQKFRIKRLIASTYQAASGGGAKLLTQLQEETKAHLNCEPISSPIPYAFNLYPHNSPLLENGYVEEEMKIAKEIRTILKDSSLKISVTSVRTPTLRAHAVSMNIEFTKSFTLNQVYEALSDVQGLEIFEDRPNNRFATPFDASGKEAVFCGRFRYDLSLPNTLEMWVVGDQLLKGAALNAVQIAELYDQNGVGDVNLSSSFVTG